MMMFKKIMLSVTLFLLVVSAGSLLTPMHVSAAEGKYCQSSYGGFFGLPTWYKYLNHISSADDCDVKFNFTEPADYVKVGLAIFEIVMRVAGLAALGFVMYGSFQLLTSQGEPDKYAGARTTLINALIGLAIALSAVAVVNLIGARVLGP